MSKMMVVAKNEFLTRVKTKWFILTTLLGPLVLIGFFVVVGLVSVNSISGDSTEIAVVDQEMLLFERLSQESITFTLFSGAEDDVRQNVLDGIYDGYMVVPTDVSEGGTIRYYSTSGGGSLFSQDMRNAVRTAVRELRVEEQDIDPEVYSAIMSDVPIDTVQLSDTGEDRGNAAVYAVVGGIMGFLLYLTMLIYGSVVMQGVMQEKQNRVVEIIVSSVRPFDLLLGKVLGIGAMGLLQMTFWAALIMGGSMLSGVIIGMFVDPASLSLPASASNEQVLEAMNFSVPTLGPEVFIFFILYFLGGYLLYATLFAAVGSTVEQQQDAQGLMLPLMMPIIASIVFLQPVIEAPDSGLAVGLSLFPFTAPIPMVVRIAMIDVPWWQIGLSLGLLFATFLGAVWVAARIYRIGILMYGKKPTLRDLARWMRQA